MIKARQIQGFLLLCAVVAMFHSCKKEEDGYAMGSFEADEVIVSSQSTGKLLEFKVEEGEKLKKGQQMGLIDAKSPELQKLQVESTIQSLNEKTADVEPQVRSLEQQIGVLQVQLANAERQQSRIQKLKEQDAATGKQLDDANTQVQVLRKKIASLQSEIAVVRNNVNTQNRSILSEKEPLEKRTQVIQNLIDDSHIVNPIDGTVLNRYVLAGEFLTTGMPLYKIANLEEVYLRAYIDKTDLDEVKLGQKVKVRIDHGEDYKYYDGEVVWIADKAEFTPKTIQTKSERENLVYAVKIKVKNDGNIKLGMYGEVAVNQGDSE